VRFVEGVICEVYSLHFFLTKEVARTVYSVPCLKSRTSGVLHFSLQLIAWVTHVGALAVDSPSGRGHNLCTEVDNPKRGCPTLSAQVAPTLTTAAAWLRTFTATITSCRNYPEHRTKRGSLPSPTKNKLAAASREGAGFRLAFTVSRCPKPRQRRGEAVAPAPVGVPEGQGVSRRRSANPVVGRRVSRGAFSRPSGGLKQYELDAPATASSF
jgi:hypothetical protein